jgi:hypothetical protein
MQQSHEEDRGGGAGAGGVGAELEETPERSLTTEAVSEAKSFAPSSALASLHSDSRRLQEEILLRSCCTRG